MSVQTGFGAEPMKRTVSLEANGEPLRSFFLRLARVSGNTVVIDPDVRGVVTVVIRNLEAAAALAVAARAGGVTLERHGTTYFVHSAAYNAALRGDRLAPQTSSAVLSFAIISARQALGILRPLFPEVDFRAVAGQNAIIATGAADELIRIRGVIQGIDTRDAGAPITEAIALRSARAGNLAHEVQIAFPSAKTSLSDAHHVLVTARPADLALIRTLLLSLDGGNESPPPTAQVSEAVRLTHQPPRDVARAIAAQVHGIRAAVAGSTIVLTGAPDVVGRAKTLVAQIDVAPSDERYTQIYRVRSLDASSVADLLRRSISMIEIVVDPKINAFTVTGTALQQQRIAEALQQLEPQTGAGAAQFGNGSAGGGAYEVVSLRSYVPGVTSGGGGDAVTTISQALQTLAPDVRIAQLPTPGQIALIGPPASVRTVREFIDVVDVIPPLVVLDTEILELDESVAKNLGLQLGSPVISSAFNEITPPNNADGTQGRLTGLQALTRTPIQFTAQLNLLVQNGKGRVLANPRITTLSGRTASIRAGDTISILTTTSGNVGTIATTQVQSFQTGVTLDITPAVTPDGEIMVNLHPVVNSLIGTNNGVPEISTRDTQTAVHLHDDETLIIGGLIQESDTRTTTKLPLLGDLPLVGTLFRNDNLQRQRNELIIVVTPHIVKAGTQAPGVQPSTIPQPTNLPTLPPNAKLPEPNGSFPLSVKHSPAGPKVEKDGAPLTSLPTASPSPLPAPNSGSEYTFGAIPASNIARANDPVRIFYANVSPTTVVTGTSVRIDTTTTTNASTVRLQVGSQSIGLSQTSPGQWQAVFPFPVVSQQPGRPIIATVQVIRADGAATAIGVPFRLAPQ